MADQTERLEAATVRAEVGSSILYRFSNDGVDEDPIPTLSGDITNLKKVILDIQTEGAEKISFATQIYPTTAAGIAGTTNGAIFLVRSSDPDEIYAVYSNNAGTAVDTGKRALSGTAITEAVDSATSAASAAQTAADTATARVAGFHSPSASDPLTRDDGSALQIGDTYFNTTTQSGRTFSSTGWVLSSVSGSDLNAAIATREPSITPGSNTDFFRGDKTFQPLNKAAVGLSNVDNTSDVNKPVSTAQQAALDGKEATIAAGTTAQFYRGDKTFQTLNKSAVGLGNVDNTSDLSKIQNTPLTGIVFSDSSDVTATDSTRSAIGKLQAKIAGSSYQRNRAATSTGSLSGSVLTFDLTTADLFTYTLSSNISLSLPVTGLPTSGYAYTVKAVFSQNNTGGYVVTPPLGTVLPTGVTALVDPSPGAITYVELTMIAGSFWMVTQRTVMLSDLPYTIPPIADDNAFFNDEGTSTSGWTPTGGTLSTTSSYLRLTKTSATGTNATASKALTMPATASDFIIYGSMRASTTGIHALWIINGAKEFSFWLGTSAANSTFTSGAASMAGYTTAKNVASVSSGLSYSTTAVNFALQYDNKFGTLTAWLRQADGSWRFGNRVLSTWFSSTSVSLVQGSGNAVNDWVEADFVTFSKPNIVAIGDSICEGKTLFSPNPSLSLTNYDSCWMRYASPYPSLRNNIIVNKGVGGQTSSQILARSADVTSTGARVCYHHMSSNDVAGSVSSATRTSNTQSSINAYAAASMSTVILNAMYGTSTAPDNTGGSALRDYVVAWWAGPRKTLTGVYSYEDIGALLKGSNGYQDATKTQSDGLHPNPSGYSTIGADLSTSH